MDIVSHRKNGFTFIELIICIAILAILAALALPSFLGLREDSKKAVCEANRTILLREYKAQCVRDNSLTLSAFLKTHERLQNNQTDCPSSGTYSTKDEATILCSKHNSTGEEPPGGGTGGEESFKDPTWNENYGYSSIAYKSDTTYPFGTVVEKDGILYCCVNESKSKDSNPDDYSVASLGTWKAIGTTNQTPIEYDYRLPYAVGTIVTSNGKTYMFTPPHNNTSYSNYPPENNEDKWTELYSGTTVNKPPKIKFSPDAKPMGKSTTYSSGNFYYNTTGVVYQYHGKTGNESLDYNSVMNGIWTQESPLYHYENARYVAGDKVWYQGKYYIAKNDFTTYQNSGYTPSATSAYWKEAQ